MDDPFVTTLHRERRAVVRDEVLRRRHTDPLRVVGEVLKSIGVAATVGIHTKGSLIGVILLGSRLSGRVYGALEQDALQILSNELAGAIENAKLYTQVQDSKIYNDLLVENLVSGVIAADGAGKITVFNREAQRISRKRPEEVLGEAFNILPGPLAAIDAGNIGYGAGCARSGGVYRILRRGHCSDPIWLYRLSWTCRRRGRRDSCF